MRRWDARLAMRGALATALVSLAAFVLAEASDQAATWRRSLAMASLLAPLAATIAVALIARRVDARGELTALEALGVSRARALLGACLGAAATAALGALGIASSWSDLGALSSSTASAWVAHGSSLEAPALGLVVDATGAVSLGPVAASAETSLSHASVAAFVCAAAMLFPAAALLRIARRAPLLSLGAAVLGVAIALVFPLVVVGVAAPALLFAPLAIPSVEVARAIASFRRASRSSGKATRRARRSSLR